MEGRRQALAESVVLKDEVQAAGGVVIRAVAGQAPEVLLVHRPKYDDWSFPKGKLLSGESHQDAAVREVLEETGLRCALGPALGTIRYPDVRGRPKAVWYWAMTPQDGSFRPSDEVDAVRWLRFDEAIGALSYDHDRELLRSMGTSFDRR